MRRMQSRSRRSSSRMSRAISGSTAVRASFMGPKVACYLPAVTAVPGREEFRALAERGNLIPVYREVLADGDTPVSAYAKLGRREHAFLLESVVGGEKWAAYSFIGVEPRAIVRWALGGKVEVTWRDVEGGGPDRSAEWAAVDPAAALSEILADFRAVAVPGLPRFWGGA